MENAGTIAPARAVAFQRVFPKLIWRAIRIVAAYLIIIAGGAVTGGIVESAAMFTTISLSDLPMAYFEGAVMGGGMGVYLGLLLCVPASFCCLPAYTFGAALGTLGIGVPIAIATGSEGLVVAYAVSTFGFLLGSLIAFFVQATTSE